MNRNVCQSAPRKIGSCSALRKLARPTHLPVSEPACASVKLRYAASTSGDADERGDEENGRGDEERREEPATLRDVPEPIASGFPVRPPPLPCAAGLYVVGRPVVANPRRAV